MIKHTFDSIRTTINERLTNPVFGSFIIAWLISNWKIPYITFFISETSLKKTNKIEYIVQNYINFDSLIITPLFYTFLILISIIFSNIISNIIQSLKNYIDYEFFKHRYLPKVKGLEIIERNKELQSDHIKLLEKENIRIKTLQELNETKEEIMTSQRDLIDELQKSNQQKDKNYKEQTEKLRNMVSNSDRVAGENHKLRRAGLLIDELKNKYSNAFYNLDAHISALKHRDEGVSIAEKIMDIQNYTKKFNEDISNFINENNPDELISDIYQQEFEERAPVG